MAPRNQNPQDPNRIDVSLDLVGEGSLAAIQQLTDAVAGLQDFVAQQGQSTAEGRAQAAASQSRRQSYDPAHVHRSGASRAASTPQQAPGQQSAHGQGGSHAGQLHDQLLHEDTAPGWRRTLGYMRGQDPVTGEPRPRRGVVNAFDREMQIYTARESEQATRRRLHGYTPDYREAGELGSQNMYDQDMVGMGGGGRGGGVSSGASAPPNGERPLPTWMRALRSNPTDWERSQESFVLPRFGELTIQDKLRMGSDFFTRSASRSYDRRLEEVQRTGTEIGWDPATIERAIADDPSLGGVALNRGRTAMALRMGADSSAQVVTAAHEMRRLFNWGSGITAAGLESGYEPGRLFGPMRLPNFSGLGSDNPYADTGATAEGLRQRLNVQRLRMRGGINLNQANDIVSGLAGMGWSGAEGQNAAFDAIAPLVQQGQQPGSVIPLFDQAVRSGNMSFQEFRQVMDDMGTSARAARMSLSEFTQGLGDFAEAATGLGATFGQGLQTGRNFAENLGVAPQVASQFMQTPLVQSMALARYNALPTEVGALGENGLTQATFDAVNLAMNVGAGFRNNPVIDPKTGAVMITGRQRQEAFAAQQMGTNVDTIKRLTRIQRLMPQINKVRNDVRTFAQDGRKMNLDATRPNAHKDTHLEALGRNMFGSKGGAQVPLPPDELVLSEAQRAQGHNELNKGWAGLYDELRSGGLTPGKNDPHYKEYLTAVEDVNKIKDPVKRGQAANQVMNKRIQEMMAPPDQRPQVHVTFTGWAERFLRQVNGNEQNKRNSNAGGPPPNRYLRDTSIDLGG